MTGTASPTDRLIDLFASSLSKAGVTIRHEDNSLHFKRVEAALPKRLPPSFSSLLSRYSFSSFEAGGISFFEWEPPDHALSTVVPPTKGSLSEFLLPSGYLQIGRPDTGNFDAVCFELNRQKQNREYRIVQVNHEEILCNSRVKLPKELWHSFQHLVEHEIGLKSWVG